MLWRVQCKNTTKPGCIIFSCTYTSCYQQYSGCFCTAPCATILYVEGGTVLNEEVWRLTPPGPLWTKLCPCRVKAIAHTTLFKPKLEYCSTVWTPYTDHNNDNIQEVQWHTGLWEGEAPQQKNKIQPVQWHNGLWEREPPQQRQDPGSTVTYWSVRKRATTTKTRSRQYSDILVCEKESYNNKNNVQAIQWHTGLWEGEPLQQNNIQAVQWHIGLWEREPPQQ